MTAQPAARIEPHQRAGDSTGTARIAEPSPRFKARMAGVFELLEGATSAYGQVVVLGGVVISGDAAATAAKILGNESLFRLGFAASLIGVLFHIAWTLLIYDLFKHVNRSISLLAVFVMLVGCAVQAVTSLLYIAPLIVLGGGSPSAGFTAEQMQALAYVFVRLNAQAFDTYLVFFGLWCVLTGYLIVRSTFLPRILGLLLAIDGLGWMIFLAPPLGLRLFPIIGVGSALGEIPLMLWLLIAGVNVRRWKEQASKAESSVHL